MSVCIECNKVTILLLFVKSDQILIIYLFIFKRDKKRLARNVIEPIVEFDVAILWEFVTL